MSGGASNKGVFGIMLKLSLFAAVAAVCLVTLSPPANAAPVSPERSMFIDPMPNPQVPRIRRSARRETRQALTRGDSERNRNPNYGHDMSCLTEQRNDTVPAAHIMGVGKFKKPDASSTLSGFQQKWRCSGHFDGMTAKQKPTHAFVDGGMCFNQTDKKLYVPECGYYQISSQILFTCRSKTAMDNHTSVYHLLKFDRNCDDWEEPSMSVMGKASVHFNNQGNTVITYTSDVVKLCKKGKIWVEILDSHTHKDCYPKGDDNGTFMSAVLVSKTTCHWPPTTTLCNLDHAADE